MTLQDLIDKQGIRDQLYTATTEFDILSMFIQELMIESLSTIIEEEIYATGVKSVKSVVNPNNTWRDYLRDDLHYDTPNSTVILDTTNHKIIF